ncbi:MAG: ligase-associated DNA damage response DEXH box helicase [Verrucomicrobiota bacterium]
MLPSFDPPVSNRSASDGIASLRSWFDRRGWSPFPFQERAWRAYARRKSGLIHAPTGIGKTLAAWGGPLAEALGADGGLEGTTAPFRILWITPLRALAADTLQALREPVSELPIPWTVQLRTGDTPQTEKKRIRQRLPTALVTTPESLSLFLSYEDSEEKMRDLRCVIVDEWHELMGTKRGVQTELCLARLRTWQPELRVWGLSATIGNLEEARSVLLGSRAKEGVTVSGKMAKTIHVETLIPEKMERFPWGGHLGVEMTSRVVERIAGTGTTLLFTNTRSQTEIWFQALLEAKPEWKTELAMHHGSLEKSLRAEVEERLAHGSVKCVVCTSSLDLGVDFSPVDQVIQIGSPKGISRFVQRAGRSGHQPGKASRIIGVPTNAFELVEFAATRGAIKARKIEARVPLTLTLDVLVQHLVTVAIGSGFEASAMRREITSTHAFAELDDLEWQWALEFVTSGGPSLQAYPDYKKVQLVEGVYRMIDKRQIQMHRMNIGTITSEPAISVRLTNGKSLGTVEEGFISRIRKGGQFIFAGRLLELVRLRELVAEVRPAKKARSKNIPKWGGSKMPLSTELSDAVAAKMRETSARSPEMRAAKGILDIQRRWSTVPQPEELLVETTDTSQGHHVFLYPFAGRLVHEGLANLLAFRLSQAEPRTIHVAFNDYGFELTSDRPFAPPVEDWPEFFRVDTLLVDLLDCMNIAELARRQFREIARVAGLIVGNFPGRQKTMRTLQASSSLLFDVFNKYDENNLLLAQSQREILERQLELGRLKATLARMTQKRLIQIQTPKLTPLAFPLWAEQVTSRQISTESPADVLARTLEDLEFTASRPKSQQPSPEFVEDAC